MYRHVGNYLLLCTLVICVVLLLQFFFAGPKEILSDTITQEASYLGAGGHILLPNLNNAKVVAPDRPHDPSEVQAKNRFERITRLRTFYVSTNSIGLRNPEIRKSKPDLRIICLGDSVTFGWGVSEEQSYPRILEEILTKDGYDVEVINAGVPAMKPVHIVNWAQKNLKSFQPDLILLARRPDHSVPNPYASFQKSISTIVNMNVAPVGLILPPLSTFDVRGNRDFKRESLELSKRISIPMLELTPFFRRNSESSGVILQQRSNLQEMINIRDGTVIAKGVSPPLTPGMPPLAPEIITAFEEHPSLKEPLFFDGGHPDKIGFVLFANEVANFVKKQFIDTK